MFDRLWSRAADVYRWIDGWQTANARTEAAKPGRARLGEGQRWLAYLAGILIGVLAAGSLLVLVVAPLLSG